MFRTPSLLLAVAVMLGCSAEPRPQIVLVIDTDAATVGQLQQDDTLAPDGAVDSLRVDFLADGEPYRSSTFAVPEPRDWPLSFGVITPDGEEGREVRIRLRAFRANMAETEWRGEEIELLPRPEISIDRLVAIELPSEGVSALRVTLALACMGRPTNYLTDKTCVDGSALGGQAIDAGVDADTGVSTSVATSTLVRVRPCEGEPRDGQVCIPGGLVVLGDPLLHGFESDVLLANAVPLQPVYLKPFWLDRTEVTVGEVRQRAGELVGPLPLLEDPSDPQLARCTWRGTDDDSHDALPINCIEPATAAELCRLRGAELPSEAQWEYAATGRGEARTYPWGDSVVQCCGAAIGKPMPCGGNALPPAGSYADVPCDGPLDISRDGVLDLGGSVSEVMRDQFERYDDPDGCWASDGIVEDALCAGDGSVRSARGASWTAGLESPRGALRKRTTGTAAAVGFRCAREDGDGR